MCTDGVSSQTRLAQRRGPWITLPHMYLEQTEEPHVCPEQADELHWRPIGQQLQHEMPCQGALQHGNAEAQVGVLCVHELARRSCHEF